MTKASPPLEDEDRGLGDSLPNTTSSSQTSLSGLPTATSSGDTPRQSPAAFRLPPADMVRENFKTDLLNFCLLLILCFQILLILMFVFLLTLQDDPLRHRLVPLQGKIPTVGGRLLTHYSFHAS